MQFVAVDSDGMLRDIVWSKTKTNVAVAIRKETTTRKAIMCCRHCMGAFDWLLESFCFSEVIWLVAEGALLSLTTSSSTPGYAVGSLDSISK